MSENIREVNSEEFESIINSAAIPVLADFWAAWCGPCRMLAPVLNELADELLGKVAVVKVNVDENEELAARFNISSIPTLLLFKKGELAEKKVGFMTKAELSEMLISYL